MTPSCDPVPVEPIMCQNSSNHAEEFPKSHEILSLNDVKKTIWLTRPDLRELCQGDWERFEWWLFVNGSREYRAIADLTQGVFSTRLAEPASEALPGVIPTLTRSMVRMWQMRPDLQSNFDLSTTDGQQSLMWWLITEGTRESEVLLPMALTACQRLLSEPAECALSLVEPPLTGFMHLIWTRRQDLQDAFDLHTTDGQQRFVAWYFIHGLRDLGFSSYLTDLQRRTLSDPDPRFSSDGVSITRLMVLIWQLRPDLQQAFSLLDVVGRRAFERWFSSHGLSEMQLGDLVVSQPASGAKMPEKKSATQASAAVGLTAPAINMRLDALAFGVNLIGYARGQFGIGEDVRMAALAMQAASIPFSIYNIEPGREVSQGDDTLNAFVRDKLPYSTNLLCTTGFETARLAAVEGEHLFMNRRTIGCWPWELSEWPIEWRHAYNLVDELWASSRYTYGAYAKTSPKLVRHMPMAVTANGSAGMERIDFGLPERRYLFCFSFDMLSSLARKNPQACLRAFKEAFPHGDEPAGLVIKAMHTASGDPVWSEFLAEACADPRVVIIDGTLSRVVVLDLYRACDCFVSLHRAEGFGRGIAEAMMLGKPAIVTGFSGNLDFTTQDNAALVGHTLRTVSPDDYPFAAGQLWAEPDVSHAAWWMRQLLLDEELRRRFAIQGRSFTTSTYAPATVGARYYAALFGTGE